MNEKILLIIKNKDKYLLLKTRKQHDAKSEWFVVTGSVEVGENNEQACRREAKEETNLDIFNIMPLEIDYNYDWRGKNYHETAYIAETNQKEVKLSIEHTDSRWVSLDNFIKLIVWHGDKIEFKNKILIIQS